MLNYQDNLLQEIIPVHLTAKEARTKIAARYRKQLDAMRNDPLWGANEPALLNATLSYTSLLADKLAQALTDLDGLDTDFAKRLWLDPIAPQPEHGAVNFYLAGDGKNTLLMTLQDALTDDARLVAVNLPTLIQITATDPERQPFEPDELTALSLITKALYTADYSFKTVDETVLQPVDGLAFATREDDTKTVAKQQAVTQAGDIELTLDLGAAALASYHVVDDQGHDWMDLGTDSQDGTILTWASTTIPDELVGHTLTLEAATRSDENVPALDELFVIASNNAILMRQGKAAGSYELALPNHQTLAVHVDAAHGKIRLSYPQRDVQILELTHQYPFFGEWLRVVLPQRRAFN
ncbi:hypothetical protein [Lacticaseibacillus mingshuiensis]|uniref:Uncharacterized protein n=1 Tax=Lacticaseibacillus mingshuiensis TaxID=2799574 RepID=A0ABW4CJK2_9LACO|nr:hypothetical protein [Lacticaseibacillus mingshuiensis]